MCVPVQIPPGPFFHYRWHWETFTCMVTLRILYLNDQWHAYKLKFSHNMLFQSYFFLLMIHLVYLTLLYPNIFLMSGKTEWCTWHCVRTVIISPCACIQWLVQSWVAVPGRKTKYYSISMKITFSVSFDASAVVHDCLYTCNDFLRTVKHCPFWCSRRLQLLPCEQMGRKDWDKERLVCLYGYLLVTCALIRVAYRIFSWGGGGSHGWFPNQSSEGLKCSLSEGERTTRCGRG